MIPLCSVVRSFEGFKSFRQAITLSIERCGNHLLSFILTMYSIQPCLPQLGAKISQRRVLEQSDRLLKSIDAMTRMAMIQNLHTENYGTSICRNQDCHVRICMGFYTRRSSTLYPRYSQSWNKLRYVLCLFFKYTIRYMYLLTSRRPSFIRQDGCDQTQRTEAIPTDEDNMRHFIYDVSLNAKQAFVEALLILLPGAAMMPVFLEEFCCIHLSSTQSATRMATMLFP